MDSILALDGTVLDFIPMCDVGKAELRAFISELPRMKYTSLFFQTLSTALTHDIGEFKRGTFFIVRRGQKELMGVIHAVVNIADIVAPEVAVLPAYQGNGYGRAMIIAMCHDIMDRGLTNATMMSADGYSDRFCKSFGMQHSISSWSVPVKEVIAC